MGSSWVGGSAFFDSFIVDGEECFSDFKRSCVGKPSSSDVGSGGEQGFFDGDDDDGVGIIEEFFEPGGEGRWGREFEIIDESLELGIGVQLR